MKSKKQNDKTTKYYFREFLSKEDMPGDSSITGFVSVSECPGPFNTFYGTLSIRDCNRTINISLNGGDTDQVKNTLHKIAIMKKTLTELEDLLKRNSDV